MFTLEIRQKGDKVLEIVLQQQLRGQCIFSICDWSATQFFNGFLLIWFKDDSLPLCGRSEDAAGTNVWASDQLNSFQ